MFQAHLYFHWPSPVISHFYRESRFIDMVFTGVNWTLGLLYLSIFKFTLIYPIPIQQYVFHVIFLHFVTPFFNIEKQNYHNLYLFDQPVYN